MTAAWQWFKLHNHLLQGVGWIILVPITLLFLKDSILWIAIMSLYANIEASFAAHGADREKMEQDKFEARVMARFDEISGREL